MKYQSGASGKQLTVAALNFLSTSGYLNHIIPKFEEDFQCSIEVTTYPNSLELMQGTDERTDHSYDLVLGLNNCMLNSSDEYGRYSKNQILKKRNIKNMYIADKTERAIPYGYGYLALLYNESLVEVPPESFGELQDSKYLSRITLSDPSLDGLGRAVLYWTIALFGDEGYSLFWQSVRKNVASVKDQWQETLYSLEKEEASLTFGLTSTPVWLNETQITPKPIDYSMLKEGSFLYIEEAAIFKTSKNKQLAEEFIYYLLSPECQKFVAFDMGLFPVNESTPLPPSFTNVPYATRYVNDNLLQEEPEANLKKWLDFWDATFSSDLF